MAAMRPAIAIYLWIRFAIGALLGLVIGVVVFPISWYRAARAVHAEGVVCRAELIIDDPRACRLAGPALVRLSGALERQATTGCDVLGLEIRLQRTASDDAAQGDQDLLFGTFESFHTAARDRAQTRSDDYLANRYSTVTRWWMPGHGPMILRLLPPPPAPADRGRDRVGRLTADLAAARARFQLVATTRKGEIELGELRLLQRLAIDDRTLRTSMLRQGRGVRPLGVRNGIRLCVYPMSQLARRLRGG